MANVKGFLNIDYANLEQAWLRAAEDIHEQTAKELFGSVDPEGLRLAKIINFNRFYGGNMRPFTQFGTYLHKPEDSVPPKESDLVFRARVFLEVSERFGPIQNEWLESRYAFRRECGRVDFSLDHQPKHLERAAEQIVAKADHLLHQPESEHCGF